MCENKKAVGVIINPIAGLGGRVGLKGSDGWNIIDKALAMGAEPESSKRASFALKELEPIKEQLQFYTYGGEMGEIQLTELGITAKIVGRQGEKRTTAEDTKAAALLLKKAGVDLIIFAGGDGTARNIFEAIGDSIPVVGIPAGVKIHSAVYATNSRNAGLVAKDFVLGMIENTKLAEVMDIDEDIFREGRLSAKLYGYLSVPEAGNRVQSTKSAAPTEAEELMGIVDHVISKMEGDVLYVVGPGTTTKSILQAMDIEGTLLGVDLVKDGKTVAVDVSESQIWEHIRQHEGRVKIMVTIIGGQGNIFGRGNQQISPRIIRKVGKKNIIVVATGAKLLSLNGEALLVDTGDQEVDQELSGYIEVVKGYAFTASYPVEC
ncbi:ATP-NAD kinase family protein [Tindallia californiensis]|uniref:Predicted polyphosphate-or ATP-dependent NAD kinase n=1 Tax=Tindallia californiensis TaxID=159292 RepID=A0A1H3IMG1_9FIRM|nr:ATP-NAD kinase family protein [Tindallia californiensis]SDY28871.1 Predicted polyphosphate-or ATP-dependent NAD kinase [Tindallia californiensis]